MFDWLKKKMAPAPSPAAANPQRLAHAEPSLAAAPLAAKGIGFNPHLIAQYHDDHRQLLTLFGRTKQAAEAGQWQEVEPLLAEFRAALTDHLLSESIRLYVYLKQRVAGDLDSMNLMRGFSSEMNAIGKLVVNFLDGQHDLGRSSAKQGAFLPMWSDIGRTLGERIAREEKTLYPMYSDNA